MMLVLNVIIPAWNKFKPRRFSKSDETYHLDGFTEWHLERNEITTEKEFQRYQIQLPLPAKYDQKNGDQ